MPTFDDEYPAEECDKRRYPSKRDAATARNRRLKGRRYGRNSKRHGRPAYLRIYACPACHGWHLTHHRNPPLNE